MLAHVRLAIGTEFRDHSLHVTFGRYWLSRSYRVFAMYGCSQAVMACSQ